MVGGLWVRPRLSAGTLDPSGETVPQPRLLWGRLRTRANGHTPLWLQIPCFYVFSATELLYSL